MHKMSFIFVVLLIMQNCSFANVITDKDSLKTKCDCAAKRSLENFSDKIEFCDSEAIECYRMDVDSFGISFISYIEPAIQEEIITEKRITLFGETINCLEDSCKSIVSILVFCDLDTTKCEVKPRFNNGIIRIFYPLDYYDDVLEMLESGPAYCWYKSYENGHCLGDVQSHVKSIKGGK